MPRAPVRRTDKGMTDEPLPPEWRRIDDVKLAVVFLTRLPIPLPGEPPAGALARAMLWFPAAGALVGALGALAYALAFVCGASPWVGAVLALIATGWVTGALHEDGLSDTADGFGGGRDRARKLEIMHDSRVGSYGALALILSVGLRASALAAIADPWTVAGALIAAHALSRAVAPVLAVLLPAARTDGLGFLCGRPAGGEAAGAVALGLGIAVAVGGLETMPLLVAGTVAAAAVTASITLRQIGGYTGDVLGAAQQAAEAIILVALSMVPR